MKVHNNDLIFDFRKMKTQMKKKYFVGRFLHVANYSFLQVEIRGEPIMMWGFVTSQIPTS